MSQSIKAAKHQTHMGKWHIQEGTPLHVLQELDGRAKADMAQKYAHLSSAPLAQWVDRQPVAFADVVPISDTFFATGQ